MRHTSIHTHLLCAHTHAHTSFLAPLRVARHIHPPHASHTPCAENARAEPVEAHQRTAGAEAPVLHRTRTRTAPRVRGPARCERHVVSLRRVFVRVPAGVPHCFRRRKQSAVFDNYLNKRLFHPCTASQRHSASRRSSPSTSSAWTHTCPYSSCTGSRRVTRVPFLPHPHARPRPVFADAAEWVERAHPGTAVVSLPVNDNAKSYKVSHPQSTPRGVPLPAVACSVPSSAAVSLHLLVWR